MYILYICYVLDSKFYTLCILNILTSILLLPSLCTRFNILLLVFYLLWLNPICYIRYCILYLLYSILYMYILYVYYVLDSKFYILYILHIWTSILLLPSLCTRFNILPLLLRCGLLAWTQFPHHSGFRLPFNSAFRVSSSTEWAVSLSYVILCIRFPF